MHVICTAGNSNLRPNTQYNKKCCSASHYNSVSTRTSSTEHSKQSSKYKVQQEREEKSQQQHNTQCEMDDRQAIGILNRAMLVKSKHGKLIPILKLNDTSVHNTCKHVDQEKSAGQATFDE